MTERIVAAFVPLVDCAVLVAAREQGFAAAEVSISSSSRSHRGPACATTSASGTSTARTRWHRCPWR
jgi:hypothetical protein